MFISYILILSQRKHRSLTIVTVPLQYITDNEEQLPDMVNE